MPAASDHYRFALSATERSPFDRAMVLLGTQGPDPFYFYSLVPWRLRLFGRCRVGAFADFLHGSDPEAVFNALAIVAASAEPDRRRKAVSFVYGLLLHYLLDRAVHPYVYYSSGFDALGRTRGRFGPDHCRFETGMAESALAGHDPAATRPEVMFASTRADLAAADGVLQAAFPDRIRSGDYGKSWRDMTKVLCFLWDPSGKKRAVLELIGAGGTRARAMIRPRLGPEGERIDFLNAAKNAWAYPATAVESRASVAELTAAAAADAERGAAALSPALDGGSVAWGDLFQSGINHEGYLPGQIMRTYRSVYLGESRE